jgi:hypothetical protein
MITDQKIGLNYNFTVEKRIISYRRSDCNICYEGKYDGAILDLQNEDANTAN